MEEQYDDVITRIRQEAELGAARGRATAMIAAAALMLAPAPAQAKSRCSPSNAFLGCPKAKLTTALWVANGTNVVEFDPGDFKKGAHNNEFTPVDVVPPSITQRSPRVSNQEVG